MPPRTVKTSVAIHACSYALGFMYAFATKGLPDSIGAVVAWLFAFTVIYFYLRAIYRGRNLVRWLSIGLTIFGTVALPWSLADIPTTVAKTIYVIQDILLLTAGILLLVPASSQWFRPDRSCKDSPCNP